MTLTEGPRRIKRYRTDWQMTPDDAVFVGRGSEWSTPYRVVSCDRRLHHDGLTEFPHPHYHLLADGVEVLPVRWATQREAVDGAVNEYRTYVLARHDKIRAALAGKDLVCWCPLRHPCHADVLLEIANA